MIKGRRLDHIGLAVTDLEASKAWYCDVLGFAVIGHFYAGSTPVYFLKNGDTVYEVYEEPIPEAVQGKIDHISFASQDIEADYAYCKEQGYTICTNDIESIPTFWEKGIRYFKLLTPTGEQVELCQIL